MIGQRSEVRSQRSAGKTVGLIVAVLIAWLLLMCHAANGAETGGLTPSKFMKGFINNGDTPALARAILQVGLGTNIISGGTNSILVVANISELKNVPTDIGISIVVVRTHAGRLTDIPDAGGGVYLFFPTAPRPFDDATCVQPNAGTGGWVLDESRPEIGLSATVFGDPITYVTLTNAIAYLANAGAGVLWIPPGESTITNTVVWPTHVSMIGAAGASLIFTGANTGFTLDGIEDVVFANLAISMSGSNAVFRLGGTAPTTNVVFSALLLADASIGVNQASGNVETAFYGLRSSNLSSLVSGTHSHNEIELGAEGFRFPYYGPNNSTLYSTPGYVAMDPGSDTTARFGPIGVNKSLSFIQETSGDTFLYMDGTTASLLVGPGRTNKTRTDNYFYIPSINDAPTGVPVNLGGVAYAPMGYDFINNHLEIYNYQDASWHAVGGGGGGGGSIWQADTATEFSLTTLGGVTIDTGTSGENPLTLSINGTPAFTFYGGGMLAGGMSLPGWGVGSYIAPGVFNFNTDGTSASIKSSSGGVTIDNGTSGATALEVKLNGSRAFSVQDVAGPGVNYTEVDASVNSGGGHFAVLTTGMAGGAGFLVEDTGTTTIDSGTSGASPLVVKVDGVQALEVYPTGGVKVTGTASSLPYPFLVAVDGISSLLVASDGSVEMDGPALTLNGGLEVAGEVDLDTTLFPNAGIKGKSSTGDAAAGNVGEYVSSAVAVGSATGLTTATAKNVTTISLTAGDWDVSGNINFISASGTVTEMVAGISATSATLPTDGTESYSGVLLTTTSDKAGITPDTKRISIGTTTTVCLVAKATFSAGTVTAFGSISARRVQPGA